MNRPLDLALHDSLQNLTHLRLLIDKSDTFLPPARDLDAGNTPFGYLLDVDLRGALADKINKVGDNLTDLHLRAEDGLDSCLAVERSGNHRRHRAGGRIRGAWSTRTGAGTGGVVPDAASGALEEIRSGVGSAAGDLPVDRIVEKKDLLLLAVIGRSQNLGDGVRQQAGNQRSPERTDAVDDDLCVPDGGRGVGRGFGADFEAEGRDVPKPVDTGGERSVLGLGEVDMRLGQAGESAGEMSITLRLFILAKKVVDLVVGDHVLGDRKASDTTFELADSGGFGTGVRNLVLTDNGCAVLERSGNMMGPAAFDDGPDHGAVSALTEAATGAEEPNGRIKAASKEAGARQEEVSDRGVAEVKDCVRVARALEDLHLKVGEDGPEEGPLVGRDSGPGGVAALTETCKLIPSLFGVFLVKAQVEEIAHSNGLGGRIGSRNQADEAGADVADAGTAKHAEQFGGGAAIVGNGNQVDQW